MTVESILRRRGTDVATIGPEASIKSAADWLRVKNIGALVVMSGDAVLGLISEREIVHAFSRYGETVGGAKMPLKQLSTDHSKANRPVNDMEVLKETDLSFRKFHPGQIRIVRQNHRIIESDVYNDKMLASGPVDITSSAIVLGSLIYQFGEAATKLNIKNLFDALSAHAIIMHQRSNWRFSKSHSLLFNIDAST